jgi:uncharacterized membrane protein YvbJ
MGFCMKCGDPAQDNEVLCKKCQMAQQPENEASPAEEIKLVPIEELSEPEVQPQPEETELSVTNKMKNKKQIKIIAIAASVLVMLTGAFFVGKAFLPGTSCSL